MKIRRLSIIVIMFFVVGLLCPGISKAQSSSNANSPKMAKVYDKITSNSKVKKALEFIKSDEDHTLSQQIKMTEIPAPSFKEGKKAKYFKSRLQELGLRNVHIDKAGNVIGIRPGKGNGPKLVVSAHLDIAFPEGTDTTVTKKNGKLHAPGISDDDRGLAAILSVARSLNEAKIQTVGDIEFVATVQEEAVKDGLGGAKALLTENDDIDGFITVDGSSTSEVGHGGTGEHLYKFTYHGPGGHAYGAFGTPSAVHALGRAIGNISDLEVPKDPKTIFNVGKVEGGTAFNAIAEKASMTIDLRSDSQEGLKNIDKQVRDIVKKAADKENKRWGSKDAITVDSDLLVNLPGGQQPADSPMVQAAYSATEAIGVKPELTTQGMTDANIAYGLGIPGLSLGGGGASKGAHSKSEWYDPTDGYLGPQKILLTSLGLVGVEGLTKPQLADTKYSDNGNTTDSNGNGGNAKGGHTNNGQGGQLADTAGDHPSGAFIGVMVVVIGTLLFAFRKKLFRV